MRLRSILFTAIATSLLTACTTPDFDPDTQTADLFEVSIEIGRLGVMTDQAGDAMSVLAPNRPSADNDLESMAGASEDLFQQLNYVLFRYNILQIQACDEGWLSGEDCKGSYLPGWAKKDKTMQPDLADLRRWGEDLQARVVALRTIVCPRAADVTGDEFFCAVE